MRRAIQLLPDTYSPVLSNGEAHAIVRDLHGEDTVDVVIAAVRGADAENRLEVLADISRLYVRGLSSPELFIFVYKSSRRRIEEYGRYGIGAPPVFKGLSFRRLSRPDAPMSVNAVVVETMRGTGLIEEWLIFGSGMEEPTRMTMRDTRNERWRVTEIDDQGVFNMLRYQTAYEQGSGIETFITRYVWDGRAYRGNESIAVVRSLNAFLDRSETLLNNYEYSAFVEFALPQHLEHNTETVLRQTFVQVPEELQQSGELPSPESTDDTGLTPRYILPRVLQSPFTVTDSPSFEIYVRAFGPHEGLYRARVQMAADLFSDSPYFFTSP